ncbi:MAG: hypothetical protein C1O27_002245 [Chloroflexi bacterium]|nr:MAG: hypothetical protein C1O27_002245 [Chloroflexota bacterium]
MDERESKKQLEDISQYAARFWAGEAEIARTFFSKQHTSEEHIRWLRLQCYKELYGSGLPASGKGIIRGLVDDVVDGYDGLESAVDRHTLMRNSELLFEEIKHYVAFADLLEELTNDMPDPEELKQYQYIEDKKLAEIRANLRNEARGLGVLAAYFTEGGAAAIFREGMNAKGDAISERIAYACGQVYEDEVDHQDSGAHGLESAAESLEDWIRVREMVTEICMQRLRMRNEQFGFPLTAERIEEIAQGKIDPVPAS